jgi:hypothetical protein
MLKEPSNFMPSTYISDHVPYKCCNEHSLAINPGWTILHPSPTDVHFLGMIQTASISFSSFLSVSLSTVFPVS